MTQDYSSLDATAVIAGLQSETLSTEALPGQDRVLLGVAQAIEQALR